MKFKNLVLIVLSFICTAALAQTTGGQPDAAALKAMSENGYAAVIDLRTTAEDRGIDEQRVVESLGMVYLSLPIAGASGVTYDNARRLDESIAAYDAPVLVHCASGNRVGALLALRAKLNGADNETALAVGLEAGLTRLESKVRELLKSRS